LILDPHQGLTDFDEKACCWFKMLKICTDFCQQETFFTKNIILEAIMTGRK